MHLRGSSELLLRRDSLCPFQVRGLQELLSLFPRICICSCSCICNERRPPAFLPPALLRRVLALMLPALVPALVLGHHHLVPLALLVLALVVLVALILIPPLVLVLVVLLLVVLLLVTIPLHAEHPL